jgi:hypothetical protein
MSAFDPKRTWELVSELSRSTATVMCSPALTNARGTTRVIDADQCADCDPLAPAPMSIDAV